jgi:hypothetical protein
MIYAQGRGKSGDWNRINCICILFIENRGLKIPEYEFFSFRTLKKIYQKYHRNMIHHMVNQNEPTVKYKISKIHKKRPSQILF